MHTLHPMFGIALLGLAAPPPAARLSAATRWGVMLTICALGTMGCQRVRGPYGFDVQYARIIPCISEEGTHIAIGWMLSRNQSSKCLEPFDPPADSPTPTDPCNSAATIQDPATGVCELEPIFQSDQKEQLLWTWEVDDIDDLTGAHAESADYSLCGGPSDDEDGPNTHIALVGTIDILEDHGDTATVDVQLDGASGEFEFGVCR